MPSISMLCFLFYDVQKEYYATHQYFLSKRSLYLVCWRVTDGEKGVLDIMQWLVNIQARAPNSAVIIVGTHLDQINKRRYPPNYLYDLQALIFDKYLRHSEPDKWGLPRVIGNIEISCKPTLMSRSHISDLVNLICTVAFEEQWPGRFMFISDVQCTFISARKIFKCSAQ